jgi:hypothetical protein
MAESDQHGSDGPSEVERLRAEVAQLRGDLEHRAPDAANGTEARTRSGWWRPTLVTVLLVIVGLLAPLSVVAEWAHDEIRDTDRYVETITPLASNPAVQAAVADRVTEEIFKRLDVKGVTQDAITALQSRGLPSAASSSLSALAGPLTNEVHSFVHGKVLKLVGSDEFNQAWEEANRAAHTQMVAVVTGETGSAVSVKGDTVSVNLATVINAVKAKLHDSGLTLVDKLPTVNAEFTIFQSADIAKVQSGFRLLEVLARGLPIVALILLALAVAVARSRRRALVAGALVVAGSMLLLGIALNAFRAVYLNAVPTDVLPANAAGAIYDQLVYFIRLNLRALLVLFLAIAFIAWVTGPAPAPTGVRRGASQALDYVRNRSDRAGMRTGGFGVALWQYRTAIRIGILGVALLVYIMAAHPTGAFTIVILVVVAAVLLVVELIARPPATNAANAAAPG